MSEAKAMFEHNELGYFNRLEFYESWSFLMVI